MGVLYRTLSHCASPFCVKDNFSCNLARFMIECGRREFLNEKPPAILAGGFLRTAAGPDLILSGAKLEVVGDEPWWEGLPGGWYAEGLSFIIRPVYVVDAIPN